jgi:glycosyltransferase involved in cell wall biosynthesis
VQTLTNEVRDNLLRNGVSADRLQLLPAPVPPPEAGIPATAVKPDSRRLILHVGGLLSRKGIWIAIRTLRAMPEDCDLVFLGSGEERDKLEYHIKQRGLDRRVRIYPDPQPADWSRFYAEADLVLAPCIWNEPLALPALRASAYGTPVVAFATGGLLDWIEDGFNGRLVDPSRRREFPQVVGALLRDPETLSQLGENARRRWQERHRMELHLEALVEGYTRVQEEFSSRRKAKSRPHKPPSLHQTPAGSSKPTSNPTSPAS